MATQSALLQTILGRLPESERQEAIRDFISNAGATESLVDLELAVSLLKENPSDDLREALLQRLQETIEAGRLPGTRSLHLHDSGLEHTLWHTIAQRLYGTACHLLEVQSKLLEVRRDDVFDIGPEASTELLLSLKQDDELHKVRSLLNFVRLQGLLETPREFINILFKAAITFLGATDKNVARLAREALCEAFLGKFPAARLNYPLLWSCLQRLMADETDAFYKGLGYLVWLHAAEDERTPLLLWIRELRYWDLLQYGLKHGDTERLKQCLAIMRCSVPIALNDSRCRHNICVRRLEPAGKLTAFWFQDIDSLVRSQPYAIIPNFCEFLTIGAGVLTTS